MELAQNRLQAEIADCFGTSTPFAAFGENENFKPKVDHSKSIVHRKEAFVRAKGIIVRWLGNGKRVYADAFASRFATHDRLK